MSGRFPAVNRCRRRHHHHRATTQGCWSWDGGGVRGWAPHILEDELTYSNQGGGEIMPTTLLLPPRIFGPSYASDHCTAMPCRPA